VGARPVVGNIETREGPVSVPRLFQVALLVWRPILARRGGEQNIPVDMTNVEEVLRELIERLGIRSAGCDSWQSIAMVQRLNGVSGCSVEPLGYGNAEQLRRGLTAKSLLYADLLELLPYKAHAPALDGGSACWADGAPAWSGEDVRRDEWRRLIRRSGKLDHPADGSKDIWDSDVSAIWKAVERQHGKLSVLWID
jgi:hypothetical protein